MYSLNLDEINLAQIKDIIPNIPKEETHLAVNASTTSIREKVNVLNFFKLPSINTLTFIIIDIPKASIYSCQWLKFLPTNFSTVSLNEEILEIILNNKKLPGREKIILRLSQLKKLVTIDANGNQISYEGQDTIAAHLNQVSQVKEVAKVYFKPTIETLQAVHAFSPAKIDELIASIPDDQTELDLSGIDLTQVKLSWFDDCFYNKLPAHIKTLKLNQINLHNLSVEFFDFFKHFFKKFDTIYLAFSEFGNLFKNDDTVHSNTKIDYLIEGTANAEVHLLKNNGEEIIYTGEEFKTKLKSLHSVSSTKDERKRINDDGERLRQKVALMNAIKGLTTRLEEEVKQFRQDGQSCMGFNSSKKAHEVEQALNRAKQNQYTTIDGFLNDGGEASIRKALGRHRIGFFGKTASLKRTDEYVDTLVARMQ